MLSIFKHITNNKGLQVRNRNRALLKKMRSLGFTPREIRLALIGANRINLSKLQTENINLSMLSRTLHGFCKRNDARQIIAGALNLNTEELF